MTGGTVFRRLFLLGIILGALLGPSISIAASEPCGAAKGLIDPNCGLKENLEKIYPISVKIIIFLAFLAVIMAGYSYITSFGQPARIEEAKNWLIAAVTGVVLILMVPVIISFLDEVGGQLPGTGGGSPGTSAPTQPQVVPDQNVPGTPTQPAA